MTVKRTRTCLTLDLKNDPGLIKKYIHYHKQENNWPEINEGIRSSGIQLMDIYLVGNRMFMICETNDGDDFEECWNKIPAYPRQSEWADLMGNFIQAIPGHGLKWVKMEQVFSLPE